MVWQWTFDVLWSLSHRPCIHNKVNGNAALDGRGEWNRKRLRSTALNNACKPGEQMIVLANGDDKRDLVRLSLLLLAATVWCSKKLVWRCHSSWGPNGSKFFPHKWVSSKVAKKCWNYNSAVILATFWIKYTSLLIWFQENILLQDNFFSSCLLVCLNWINFLILTV